jgi:hypothetical protein
MTQLRLAAKSEGSALLRLDYFAQLLDSKRGIAVGHQFEHVWN